MAESALTVDFASANHRARAFRSDRRDRLKFVSRKLRMCASACKVFTGSVFGGSARMHASEGVRLDTSCLAKRRSISARLDDHSFQRKWQRLPQGPCRDAASEYHGDMGVLSTGLIATEDGHHGVT